MDSASVLCVGPDDMFLALRGLRTLSVRLARHQQSALRVAQWLEKRPEVLRRLHPALPNDPGHAIWKRDFTGACGLFSIVLKPASQQAVYAFMNALTLFGMDFLGGFESLVIIFDCSEYRSATTWAPGGDAALSHRAGRRRRSHRRSRARLRGDEDNEMTLRRAPCPPLRMTNCRLRK